MHVEISPLPVVEEDTPKPLYLPPKNKNSERVERYLFGVGINCKLILECIAVGMIYESADYYNAVFIGNRVNQLAVKVNTLGFVDTPMLMQEAKKWHDFQIDMRGKYLLSQMCLV